jgi:hypothetical protein
MLEGRNVTVLRFHRPDDPPPAGRDLAPECRVSLTVRVDIEDRNFHSETRRNGGAEHQDRDGIRKLGSEIHEAHDAEDGIPDDVDECDRGGRRGPPHRI